jgi:hypothetical protein
MIAYAEERTKSQHHDPEEEIDVNASEVVDLYHDHSHSYHSSA